MGENKALPEITVQQSNDANIATLQKVIKIWPQLKAVSDQPSKDHHNKKQNKAQCANGRTGLANNSRHK